jgi:hypothetical protein
MPILSLLQANLIEVHAALFIVNTLAGFTETKYLTSPLIKNQLSLINETKSNFSKEKRPNTRVLCRLGKKVVEKGFLGLASILKIFGLVGEQKKKSAVLLTMTQFLFLAHSSKKGGPLGGEESSTLCQ